MSEENTATDLMAALQASLKQAKAAREEVATSTEEDLCVRCKERFAPAVCCESHGGLLCHRCYRLTHFVEVCGEACPLCRAEGLPVILRAGGTPDE